jgi:hypothetical protein
MSMHLVGPYMTTTNTKKRKEQKFRSAEHKAKYLAEKAEWEKILKKYEIDKLRKKKVQSKEVYKPTEPFRRETEHYPSLNSADVCGAATKPPAKVYTGTLIKGIATMHKSNAVPVFNSEQAIEISKMRRG